MFKRLKSRLAVVAGLGLAMGSAMAEGFDPSAEVTSGITTLETIIGVVAGLAVTVVLVWKAVKYFRKA